MSRCCPNCGFEFLTVVEPPKARRTDPSTSKRAALANAPRRGCQRDLILQAILSRVSGLTADEAAGMLGLPYVSVSTRVSELKAGGWIQPLGTRSTSSGGVADVLHGTEKARLHFLRERTAA